MSTAKNTNILRVFTFSSWVKFFFIVGIIASLIFIFNFGLFPEQRAFKRFVEHTMLRHYGIYTLMGSKPMTCIDISYYPPSYHEKLKIWKNLPISKKIENSVDDIIFPKYSAKKIWKDWLRIQHKYLGNNYVIVPDNDRVIYFINRTSFLDVVEKNRHIFEEILKRKISGNELLNCISENSEVWQKLKKSHVLMGILYGFGLHNSQQFERYMEGEKTIDSHLIGGKNNNLVCEAPRLSEIALPAFRSFDSNSHIEAHFEKERTKIIENLKKRNIYSFTAKTLKK